MKEPLGGHTANERESWDVNPGRLAQGFRAYVTMTHCPLVLLAQFQWSANGVKKTRPYMMNAIHMFMEDIKIPQMSTRGNSFNKKISFDINIY